MMIMNIIKATRETAIIAIADIIIAVSSEFMFELHAALLLELTFALLLELAFAVGNGTTRIEFHPHGDGGAFAKGFVKHWPYPSTITDSPKCDIHGPENVPNCLNSRV